jgi:hypothetical protein
MKFLSMSFLPSSCNLVFLGSTFLPRLFLLRHIQFVLFLTYKLGSWRRGSEDEFKMDLREAVVRMLVGTGLAESMVLVMLNLRIKLH